MDPQDPHYDPFDRMDLDGARVEDDTMKPLTRVPHTSRNRLPAAVSFALVGLLVIGGVALGANVVMPLIGAPNATIIPDETDPPEVAVQTDQPTTAPTATPTEAPTEAATEAPTAAATEAPTATATATATVKATAKPTVKPTPKPTAPPANSANLGNIAVTDKGNGCYDFRWTAYAGSIDFNYYKFVGETWPTVPDYTATGHYWAVLDTSATSFSKCLQNGDYAIRVQAIYYPNGAAAAAQTNILHLTVTKAQAPAAPVNLGNITVTDKGNGCYDFHWNAYTGPIDFNYYKFVGETWPTVPDYTATGHYWAVVDAGTTTFSKCLKAGDYAIRAQAIYYPDGAAAAGQTNILHLTVNASAPTNPPAPVTLTLTATPSTGKVDLAWSKYTGAGFQYYKVVRSETNNNPMYPENSGTTLIAAIDNVSTLSFSDTCVEAGHTYYYRVIAYTFENGGAVLGKSGVKTVQAQ